MMSIDEPACLSVGTEVSAKYRGAFCEAKVKKIVKTVKVKVNLKDGGSVVALDDDLRGGPTRLGCIVEVKHPETQDYMEGTITKITDASMYTVVFDDSDENTLRRTQLCLKGEKHFVKTDTLDELPLTHPEHFGTPVMRGSGRKRRRSPANADSDDSDSDEESSDDDMPPKRRYGSRLEVLLGRILLMEQEDRKKSYWVPVLVCQPSADESTDLKTRDHLLVKSFKDSKYYGIAKKQTKDFSRDFAMKNEDKVLKNAFEKALLYYDAKELPQHWDKDAILGSDSEEEEDDESSDDEPSEEKDRFVAQLYKFMDDRGTPINKGPVIGNRDLNLYKLFRIVQNIGGYNRVTNQMKWRFVYSKMGLPPSAVAANQVKAAYKKYLHAFEDFYRKLGSTMGTISRPMRTPRHTGSGGGRSILSFRERDREGTPKSPGRSKKKDDEDEEDGPPIAIKDDVRIPEKSEMKTRSKVDSVRPESREESEAESESPRKRTRGLIEQEKKVPEEPKKEKIALRPASREDGSRERTKTIPSNKEEEKKVIKEEDLASEKDDEGKHPRRRGRKKADEVEEKEDKPVEKTPVKLPEKLIVPEIKKEIVPYESSEEENTDTEQKTEEDVKHFISNAEYPPGSKLKVRYGKGRNAKVYDAKVVEAKLSGSSGQYKVHYAGWNIRYDEWVKKENIVSCLDRPRARTSLHIAKQKSVPSEKKIDKSASRASRPQPSTPNAPSSVSSVESRTAPSRTSKSPVPSTSKPPRPTRSTSMENPLLHGLPTRTVKRRLRRLSGMTDDIQSRDSSTSDSDTESENETNGSGPPLLDDEDEDHLDKSSDTSTVDHEEISKMSPKKSEPVPPFLKLSEPPNDKESAVKCNEVIHTPMDTSDMSKKENVKETVLASPKRAVVEMEKVSFEPLAKPSVAALSMDKISIQEKVIDMLKDAKKEIIKDTDSAKESDMSDNEVKSPAKGRRKGRKRQASESVSEDGKKTNTDSKEKKLNPEPKDKKLNTEIKEKKIISEPKEKKVTAEPKDKIQLPESEDKIILTESKDSTESTKSIVSPPKETTPVKCVEKNENLTEEPRSMKKRAVKVLKVTEKVPESDVKKIVKLKSKRKIDKIEEGEQKDEATVEPAKKVRRKRETKKKDECTVPSKESEEIPVKKSPSQANTSNSSPEKPCTSLLSPSSSSAITSNEPCISIEVLPSSPPPQPAPHLTATLSLEVKEESEVDNIPAPCLSPIIAPQPGPNPAPEVANTVPSVQPVPEIIPPITGPTPANALEPNIVEANSEEKALVIPPPVAVPPAAAMMENTPPATPERPLTPPSEQVSPRQSVEDVASTKSEHEANMEVETLMANAPAPPGGESPNACDMSTVSVGSGGSSGNAPGSESEGHVAVLPAATKCKEELDESPPTKRRRRGHKRASGTVPVEKNKRSKAGGSDSDEGEGPTTSHNVSPAKRGSTSTNTESRTTRPCKYNFLDLEEGKYLEGEKRIEFLIDKIKDLRTIYMQIKSEVATIDRRRKRARRKEAQAKQKEEGEKS